MIDISNYNKNNVFAKILRNEIDCDKIYENSYVLAFKDIKPLAPIHVLIIPKKEFCSFQDFTESCDDKYLLEFFRSINKIVKKLKLEDGYKLVCNVGTKGGQEVQHLHFHLLAPAFS